MRTWDDLTHQEQSRVLDKYRHINVEHDWWESALDMFREDMKARGIDVGPNVCFDYGQAAFEGSVSDWVLFLTHLGYDNEWLLSHFSDHASFAVKIDHRRHYPKMEAEAELPLPDSDPEYHEEFLYQYGTWDEFRDAALLAALSQYDSKSMEKDFLSVFEDYARDLARMLEEEYQYLTSDDGVLESLQSSDMLDEAVLEVLGDEEEDEEEIDV
jgi:hypothetical protein